MPAYELGAKLFFADGYSVDSHEYIPLFHRLIREQAFPGELLIDVSDYGHVASGPGVIMVAHGAIYGIDEEHGRPGLLYRRRRVETDVDLDAQLTQVLGRLFSAALLLEAAPELRGRLQLRGDEIEVSSFSRLHAPNTAATAALFKPALDGCVERLWPGADVARLSPRDKRERFGVRLVAPAATPVATLQSRVGRVA